jgi:hypothetical protein
MARLAIFRKLSSFSKHIQLLPSPECAQQLQPHVCQRQGRALSPSLGRGGCSTGRCPQDFDLQGREVFIVVVVVVAVVVAMVELFFY